MRVQSGALVLFDNACDFHPQGQGNVDGYSRLLAAVLEALCHPTVKLTVLMPINCEHSTEMMLKRQYSSNDNTNSAAHSGIYN